jgi:indolepyruvate ferredoxin oxidoreductase
VLLVAGDDHGAYSSTLPHQSDHIFSACMIPVLYPCNVQEYLDLGVHGWAMSRFSGCTVAFKALADTVESSASVDADPHRVEVKMPQDFAMPEGGLNTRLSSVPLGQQARKQEALMQDYKIYAALAYARENKLNHTTIDSPNAKLGIIASGKSYLDVLEALEELGIDEKWPPSRPAPVQGRDAWPLEPDRRARIRAGPGRDPGGRRKAPGRRIPAQGTAVQLARRRAPAHHRQVRRQGRMGGAARRMAAAAKADFSVSQVARVIAAASGA